MRRRLPRHERERLIIDEAIRFFAEVGFEGQTRALAQRLGVTQPLLYRYFPDKDALIERVFQESLLGSWDPAWERTLTDRSRPLLGRITEIYEQYARTHLSYERVRLFLFAGLKDQQVAARYLSFIRIHLIVPICRELRVEAGFSPEGPISEAELECVWGLHGAIAHMGMRRWVYQAPGLEDICTNVAEQVATFLLGAPATFRDILTREAAQ